MSGPGGVTGPCGPPASPGAPPRPAVHSSDLHGICGGGCVLAGVPRPATLGFPPISLTPGSVECPSWAGSHLVDLGKASGSNILPNFLPGVFFLLLRCKSNLHTQIRILYQTFSSLWLVFCFS